MSSSAGPITRLTRYEPEEMLRKVPDEVLCLELAALQRDISEPGLEAPEIIRLANAIQAVDETIKAHERQRLWAAEDLRRKAELAKKCHEGVYSGRWGSRKSRCKRNGVYLEDHGEMVQVPGKRDANGHTVYEKAGPKMYCKQHSNVGKEERYQAQVTRDRQASDRAFAQRRREYYKDDIYYLFGPLLDWASPAYSSGAVRMASPRAIRRLETETISGS